MYYYTNKILHVKMLPAHQYISTRSHHIYRNIYSVKYSGIYISLEVICINRLEPNFHVCNNNVIYIWTYLIKHIVETLKKDCILNVPFKRYSLDTVKYTNHMSEATLFVILSECNNIAIFRKKILTISEGLQYLN